MWGLVDLRSRTVVDDHGFPWPVEVWLDADGDECDPDQAVACCAHLMGDNKWLTISFDPLDQPTRH